MRTISLCITTYNRFELTMNSFAQVLNDPRISEIIISDDCSTDGSYDKLKEAVKDCSKIRLLRHEKNQGMSFNKAWAISSAMNDYCIILDSDNVISTEYIDAVYSLEPFWAEGIILCPTFARPNFDFRKFAGDNYGISNIKELISIGAGEIAMNTCNYFVNATEYTKAWVDNRLMKGTDTLWFNYNWLKAGNSFYFVDGMEYDHLVHKGSEFMKHCDYNMKKAKELKRLIMKL